VSSRRRIRLHPSPHLPRPSHTPPTADCDLSPSYPYFPISIFDFPRKSIVSPTSTRLARNPFVSPTSAKTGGYPPSIPNPRSTRYGSPSALCPLFPTCRLQTVSFRHSPNWPPRVSLAPRAVASGRKPPSANSFPYVSYANPQGTLTLCSTQSACAGADLEVGQHTTQAAPDQPPISEATPVPNARGPRSTGHRARATDHGPLRTGRWQLVAGHRSPKFPMYPIGKFDASSSTVSRPQP
jgi:hypothetical protein